MELTKKLAVFDPGTKFEFDSGVVEDTLNKYLAHKPSDEYCFDFFFLYNAGDNEYYKKLKEYEKHPNINRIILLNQNIPKELDTYHKDCILRYDGAKLYHELLPPPDVIPPLGGTSGPNLSFYIAIDMMVSEMYDYENYFMIENDSFPCEEYWFDHILEYIDKLPRDYLIAGSTYKGHQKWHHVLNYKDHLNGVAIYNNTPALLKFIQEGRKYHETMVTPENWSVNFDIALDKFSKTTRGRDLTKNRELLIDTDFITNVSDPLDSYLTQDNVKSLEPNTIIIHQKQFQGLDPARTPYTPKITIQETESTGEVTKVPYFLRTPRSAGNYVLRYTSKRLVEYCKQNNTIPYFFKVDFTGGSSCDVFAQADEPLFDPTEWIQFRQGVDPKPPNRVNLDELAKEVRERNLKILFISNDPFVKNLSAREIIYEMQQMLGDLSYHTLIREPYERTKSLCKFPSDEQFLNYLESTELQDSWMIRTICNLDFGREVEYFHYEHAYEMIKHFKIKDVVYAKELVDEMLEEAYGIPAGDDSVVEKQFYRKSKYKAQFNRQELRKFNYIHRPNINLDEIFTGRTYFDQMLYDRLTKEKLLNK